MAKAKKVTLASLVPPDALGTKFVATGFLAEVFKTERDGEGRNLETDEIVAHIVGVQLINPINDDLARLTINVKVKNLLTIDQKLKQSLLNYSVISFEDLNFGEFNQNFWVNASSLTVIQDRSENK